jgi:hypothetical protein
LPRLRWTFWRFRCWLLVCVPLLSRHLDAMHPRKGTTGRDGNMLQRKLAYQLSSALSLACVVVVLVISGLANLNPGLAAADIGIAPDMPNGLVCFAAAVVALLFCVHFLVQARTFVVADRRTSRKMFGRH